MYGIPTKKVGDSTGDGHVGKSGARDGPSGETMSDATMWGCTLRSRLCRVWRGRARTALGLRGRLHEDALELRVVEKSHLFGTAALCGTWESPCYAGGRGPS